MLQYWFSSVENCCESATEAMPLKYFSFNETCYQTVFSEYQGADLRLGVLV